MSEKGLSRRAAKPRPRLLRHFPKALAGNPDDLSRMKPYGKLPLEVVATVEGDSVRFTALKDGKPLPKADFVTVDANLTNTTVTADAEGKALWKPAKPGAYSVYRVLDSLFRRASP